MVTLVISLFTARVVLQVLGIEDYGIYNLVGGVVSIFTVISGAMQTSSQRYITFALGTDDKEYLKKVFSNSVIIHILLALIICILVETIGLWLLYNKLVIPSDKIAAAFWVMQCSLLSVGIGIWSVPYNAVIIAHEKMSTFAYISIIEIVLRLLIVLTLFYTNSNRLVLYAALLLAVQILMRIIYGWYSYRHFEETRVKFNKDIILFKEMLGFAGWSMTGTISGALYTQGINILLNLFFGPMVNAARGVAVQVQGAVHQFVNNFQTAVNPQITKSYALGDLQRMHKLLFFCSKFSFFLLLAMILPLMIKTEFILNLWLDEVPIWTVSFTQWLLLVVLIDAMSNPLITSVQATGQIKRYQLIINSIQFLFFPITYIILKLGYSPYTVFIVQFLSCIATYIARVILLKRMVNFSFRLLIDNVWKKILAVGLSSLILPVTLDLIISHTFFNNCIIIIITILSVIISSFFFGLTHNESLFFFNKFKRILLSFYK